MMYIGDYPADQAIYFMWNTNDGSGASITRATDGTLSVYKDNSDGSSFDQTQVTTGITNDEDVDGLTGIHSCCITTTDAWYETAHDYVVVLSASTIDGETVNAVIAHFSIENRFMRGTDSAALASTVGAAGAGLTDLGGMSTGMKGEVNDEVADVYKVDTTSEPTQGAPPSSPTSEEMQKYIYFRMMNKNEETVSEHAVYDAAGTTKVTKATVSDSAGVLTKGKFVSGA